MALIEKTLEEMRRWRPENDKLSRPADSFSDAIRGPVPAPAPVPTQAMAPMMRNPLPDLSPLADMLRDVNSERRDRESRSRPADSFSDAIRGPAPVAPPAPQTQLAPEQRDAIVGIDPATRSRVESSGWRTPRSYNPPSVEKDEPGWDWRTFNRPYGEGPLTEQEEFSRQTMQAYGVQPDVAQRVMEETRIFGGGPVGSDGFDVVPDASGWYMPQSGSVWMDDPNSGTALHEFAHHDRDAGRPTFPMRKRKQLSLALDDEIERQGPSAQYLEANRSVFGDEHMYQYLIGGIKGDLGLIESPYLREILGDFYTGVREPGISWPEALYREPGKFSGNYQTYAQHDPDYFWQADSETAAANMPGNYPGWTAPDRAIRAFDETTVKAASVVNDILDAKGRGVVDDWAREHPDIWNRLPRKVKMRLTSNPSLLGPDENGRLG